MRGAGAVSSPRQAPGWPADVYPPGAMGWERTAVTWLWQWLPPGYRRYELLHRDALLLGHLARLEVAASLEAARLGRSTLRAELGGVLSPARLEQALAVLDEEERHLADLARQVGLVAGALAEAVRTHA